MQGHRLLRSPKKIDMQGGKGNLIGCECGAISMAPTLAQRLAWHAEHLRGLPEPAVERHRKVVENQAILAGLTERLAAVGGG